VFGETDHARLAALLSNCEGKWLLSYNDCPKIRSLYGGHEVRPLRAVRYAGKVKHAGELLIANYPLPRRHSAV